MSQEKRFKAKKDFKLDCGHVVKAGEEFVVVKSFVCEIDAATMPYARKSKQMRTNGLKAEPKEVAPDLAEE